MEYEVFSHKITQLHIGNSLESDRSEGIRHIDDIPKKSLILRDLGYYTLDIYKQLEQRELFYISRLHSQIKIYIKTGRGFEIITHQMILEKLADEKYIDLEVYIGKQAKHPVRLVANKLDEQQTSRRIKRASVRKTKVQQKESH